MSLEGCPARVRVYATQLDEAGDLYNVDPYLLAAIMDRESLCGLLLRPRGPAGKGDFEVGEDGIRHGHGHGLMQIDDRTWGTWLARAAWYEPAINVCKGARILRENLDGLAGDIEGAIAAYNAGFPRVRRLLGDLPPGTDEEGKVRALDNLTTGKDYVSKVLLRFRNWKAKSVPKHA